MKWKNRITYLFGGNTMPVWESKVVHEFVNLPRGKNRSKIEYRTILKNLGLKDGSHSEPSWYPMTLIRTS